MPNIFKHLARAQAEPYQFPDAAELISFEPEPVPDPEDMELSGEEREAEEEISPEEAPIRYAQIQAESILEDARRQAEAILEKAREEARREAELIHEEARLDGQQRGYAEGIARAMNEGARRREEKAAEQELEIQQFLERAGATFDRQMDDCVDDLRDLALAVAEKVVSVSLRSSSEVISRMIQTAIDKRKRREWVHIYIAECDAKRMAQVPASLTAALSALSDRVRIIPMADDESGTCIIEMPDEIIDASAATQLNNIRSILSDAPMGGRDAIFQRRRSEDRVPANDSSGL